MRRPAFTEATTSALRQASDLNPAVLGGTIIGLSGLAIRVAGLERQVKVGDRVTLHNLAEADVLAEIVGFDRGLCHAMTYGSSVGLGSGTRVPATLPAAQSNLAVADQWIGRGLDPLSRPLDARGPMTKGDVGRTLRCDPPAATGRAGLRPPLDLAVPPG